MIRELSEGVKISFMDRKETDLERKVRKLELDMMHLDSILNKEKQVRKKSMGYEKAPTSSPLMTSHHRLLQDHATIMAQGDAPDPWQMMPVHIHRSTTSSPVQPAFFFTWDCTPYDFHNNSAQRSIYTLLDQWKPGGNSMSADQFKKQLGALLAANKESPSTTDLAMTHHLDIVDITSPFEKLDSYITKSEIDIQKLDLKTSNVGLNTKKTETDGKSPDLDTKELLADLEKKLKEVESKCRDDFDKVLNPLAVSKTKSEESIAETEGNETEKIDEDNAIIDDLIFELFKDSPEEFGSKPIELAKEVDDLQSLITSYNQAGDTFQKIDSLK